MSKVYGRNPNEKLPIKLNSEGQPIGDDGRVLTELSNFLGTLVRDNVSLTFINWHVVPEETKQKMWKCALVTSITKVFLFTIIFIFVY